MNTNHSDSIVLIAAALFNFYVAIEDHRSIEKIWLELEDAFEKRNLEVSRKTVDSAFTATEAAAKKLAKTVPTTLGGVSLLNYIDTHNKYFGAEDWYSDGMSNATFALACLLGRAWARTARIVHAERSFSSTHSVREREAGVLFDHLVGACD